MTPDRLQVPDPQRLASVQAFCDLPRPYDQNDEVERLFLGAMNEMLAWHSEHNGFYKRLLARHGLENTRVESLDECSRLPAIHANFFKTHEVLSIPRDKVSLHLTSSGTTGQKSQMFFDDWSIGAVKRMVDRVHEHYGWVSEQPANYLFFNYEPIEHWKVATSWTVTSMTRFAPASRTFFALRATGSGGHEFDVFGTLRTLEEYADEDLPVRIIGFPAFMHATLLRMQALKLPPLQLPPGSMVFFGGGWKGQADKAISKEALRELIQAQLSIPDELIRDGFGSVEQGVPYQECPQHRFHAPIWSKLLVRDLRTLKPLPAGEPGFLSFLAPFMTSVPNHNIIMGDLAAWYPGSDCGCGLETPWFELLGRAGLSKNRSCAVAASELLKGVTA